VYDEGAWGVCPRTLLPRIATFRRIAASLGVDDTSTVVLYTRDPFYGSGKVWGGYLGVEEEGKSGSATPTEESGEEYSDDSIEWDRAAAVLDSQGGISALASDTPKPTPESSISQPCLTIYKVWWLFHHYGIRSCTILMGGLQGWAKAGYPLATCPECDPLLHMGLRSGEDLGTLRTASDVLAYFGGGESRAHAEGQLAQGGTSTRGSDRDRPLKRLEALISGSSAEVGCVASRSTITPSGGSANPAPHTGPSRLSTQRLRFIGRLIDTTRGASLREYRKYLELYRAPLAGAVVDSDHLQDAALDAILQAETRYRSLPFTDLRYANLSFSYQRVEKLGREQASGLPSRIRRIDSGTWPEKALVGCKTYGEACARLEARKVLFCPATRLFHREYDFSPASKESFRRHFHLDTDMVSPDDFVTFVGDDLSHLALSCFCWCFATGASPRAVSLIPRSQLELLIGYRPESEDR